MLPTDPKNIVVRMPNWLGDLVMATPVLHDLRIRFLMRISRRCASIPLHLARHDPNVDQLFRFTRINGWFHNILGYHILEPLRQNEYDLGILLTNSLSSAWWLWVDTSNIAWDILAIGGVGC